MKAHRAHLRRIICLAFLLPSLDSASAEKQPATLVSADDSKIVFEIDLSGYTLRPSARLTGGEVLDVPGFGSFAAEGEPLVPARRFLVALPPQGGYSLSFRVLRSEVLGPRRLEPVPYAVVGEDENGLPTASVDYRVDDEVYNAARSFIQVLADPETRLRHQRVLPIRVTPVTYDPQSGETVIATSIRVEISLSRSGGPRPTVARPVTETNVWERIYSRTLINPEQARPWRTKSRSPAPGVQSSLRSTITTAGPLVKLAVRESAMHRVSAANVIAKGFPAGTPTGQLHLFKRHYNETSLTGEVTDVHFKVVEDGSGEAGTFDGNDYVVFYAQRLREDELQGDAIEKFSNSNAYWLGASGGPQMTVKTVSAGTVTGDTATATFPVSAYFEEDLFFLEETPPLIREFYYYNSQLAADFLAPFTLGAVDPSSNFTVKGRFMGDGARNLPGARNVMVEIVNANGTTRLTDAAVPRRNVFDYESQPLPASLLVEGLNRLAIEPIGRGVLQVVLDYFTIEYNSPYRARGNVLEFNAGALSGPESVTVVGLNSKDVMLFAITDPYAVQECGLDASHFTDVGGGGYALSFQGNFAGDERFIVTPLTAIEEISGADIIADEPSTLIGNPLENGVDVLVVSHKDFIGEMQRWVSYRRAQGYRVLMVDADDVYDEFSGGVPNARAIKRFVRHFFDKGGAAFLLLVGDASEDNKRVHVESMPNFVPSESFTEYVGGGFDEDEVVTTDKWFVMLGKDIVYDPTATDPADFFPDLLVGRLPVGNVTELRNVLDKTFAYETPAADDFWRRRMLRVADDEWSGGNLICDRNEPFWAAEEGAATITENSLAGGYDVVRFFLQDRISHPNVPCPGVSVFSQCQVARADATPVLINEMSQGATIVSINAHMNRFQICHEWLFTSDATIASPQRDHERIQNFGKPFILYGMGCHLSDYALHKERSQRNQRQNGPNGDCISELMLLLADRGAVSTYGSTGFEYLNENVNYTRLIAETFFAAPPTDPVLPDNRRQARWIMGEVMTAAEIENLLRFPVGAGLGARGQAKRYHTLGDPLLRIDAGPPRFEVTVDDTPVQSGDPVFAGSASDSITVRAVISDEVAIEKLELEIDGADATNLMTITPLVDQSYDASRQYEVTFKHKIRPDRYDIILRAHQAADTTGNSYHMVAEFVLKVELNIALTVDGRPIVDGDFVPANGTYVFELKFPIEVDRAIIRAEINGNAVPDLSLVHPSPDEKTTWLASFTANLANGAHKVSIFVGTSEFSFNVQVGGQLGLRDVMVYPNPFVDDTYFVYSNDINITSGTIDIFTTSGKRIASLRIPSESTAVGQNAVYWNGRAHGGNTIANGVYLFVFNINQNGRSSTHRGKLVHAR